MTGQYRKAHRHFSKRVFLDIPYKKTYRKYERLIRATLIAYGLEPVVARDSRATQYLLDDVANQIQSSKYAVVDISGLNFNVGFEAGYLTALGRSFILLKDKKTKMPSDLQGIKYSQYSNRAGFIKELLSWLQQNVPEAKEIPEQKAVTDILNRIKKRSRLSDDSAVDVLAVLLTRLADSEGELPY